MVTKPKSNSVITHELSASADALTFHVKDAGSVTLELAALSREVADRAMIHGMIQRISDAAALSRDEDTGLPASAHDKLAAMKELVDHYASGTKEWSRKRTGGGGERTGLLFQCLMEMYPEAGADKIKAKLAAWTKSEKAAMLVSPKVKEVADRIRAKAVKEIDAEALLSDF